MNIDGEAGGEVSDICGEAECLEVVECVGDTFSTALDWEGWDIDSVGGGGGGLEGEGGIGET